MNYVKLAIIAVLAGALGAALIYRFAPLSILENGSAKPSFGSTVTTINGSDTLSSSRTTINTNFSNLNTGKFELSSWYATTSAAQLTTLANLTTVGTIGAGTWQSTTPVGLAYGGTAATSYTTSGATLYYTGSTFATAPLTSAVTFTFASTTALSASGRLYSTDTVNSWSGPLNPTHSFVLSTATTTTWGGTTTPAYVPTLTMPFAGTLRQARCTASSTQAFLGVTPYINTTKTTPSYFVASTTIGVEKFTANNTFSAGDRISIFVGTTTTDANALFVSCTFDITQS